MSINQHMTLPLPNGKEVLVDQCDYAALSRFKWRLSSFGYAKSDRRTSRTARGRETFFMHREIMGLSIGDTREVDHINGNRLDNRRCNLRLSTHAQNMRNALLRKDNSSGFKGAFWRMRDRKWYAAINISGKRVHLGVFGTAEEAHAAYCLAADRLYGEFANYGGK